MDPAFSVVIPTYDRAGFVVEAVESVLLQTDDDFELIVVDDGSRDATPEVLQPYRGRLRYIRQENRGMAGARNTGIRAARGEFVALLDSDDRWTPELLSVVRATFSKHPGTGAVFIAEREIDERGRPGSKINTKRSPGLFFSPQGMVGRDTGVGSGRPPVARRELFERYGYYDEALAGAWDCDLWIRLSFHVPMLVIPDPLVLRRVHPGNFSADQLKDAIGWLSILDKIAREHPAFVREHATVYHRTRGKSHLRLGRELLARCAEDRSLLPRSRLELARAIRHYPLFIRAWTYLAVSVFAPTAFGDWRRRQLERRYGRPRSARAPSAASYTPSVRSANRSQS